MRTFMMLGLTGLAFSAPSWADPIVLQCEIQSGGSKIYGKADQIVIDLDKQYVELRVARTIGTDYEVNWDFTTQTKPGIEDHFGVRRFTDDGTIFGGGVRAASGEAFELVGGVLTWTALYQGKVDTMRWRCR
ncbi:hypothetical protein [Mesorhizobium loti]|uniref:hypothetical protein n=1 Tax=Rhizobium loti TaxID=381 RepID=UPI00047BA2A0|nr:hypothetical protein [Mesorhizobium loti]